MILKLGKKNQNNLIKNSHKLLNTLASKHMKR